MKFLPHECKQTFAELYDIYYILIFNKLSLNNKKNCSKLAEHKSKKINEQKSNN